MSGPPKLTFSELLVAATKEFELALGIAGDDQVSRVRRRLLQPEIDAWVEAESRRIFGEIRKKMPVDTGAMRRLVEIDARALADARKRKTK